MSDEPQSSKLLPDDPNVRPHTYDGIQEFDHKLPNWWLWTFYGAIIFTFFYWFLFYDSSLLVADGARVQTQIEAMEAERLASIGEVSDETLWQMSRNPAFVSAGKTVYNNEGTCVTCHGPNLEGGIGLNLADQEWKWGNRPMSIFAVVKDGSPDTSAGMQAWERQLGAQKVQQVVAYILSYHEEAEMASAPTLNEPVEPSL
ncbi:MAG: cbb3-type cytochrome c oxidase N-terminal domain-containing protein [Opitutales bacterium]